MSRLSVIAPPKEVFSGPPIKQTPDALKNSCFPPRPNEQQSPGYFGVWQGIARQPLQYVAPELEESEGLDESKNWAGAVLPVRQRAVYPSSETPIYDPFKQVVGSWTVPNLYPQKNEDGFYQDGDYRFYSWVGLDGWKNPVCLKIGVESRLKVKHGMIESRSHIPAILMRGSSDESIRVTLLKNLSIESGDYISGFVWSANEGKAGCGCIINHGSGQFSSAMVEAAQGVVVRGESAEWIGATQVPGPNSHPAPNFGAMFFSNGFAVHDRFEEAGMIRGLLANAEEAASTAKRPHTVVVYAQRWVPLPEVS
ncbi:hypothetical protein DL769_001007 [Monosporascus sp. CRB-8-3]|nr:hypothetical protein DL769_001007 [Monosporascus sp. CRB-8-3]